MANIENGFYDDDFRDDRFELSWLDLIILAVMVFFICIWQMFCRVFSKAKKKLIPKASNDEYADWFEKQRP